MAVQRLIRPTLVLAGGALVVALTAGCQGQFTANGSATDNSGSATVSAGSSPSAALGGSTEDSGPTSTASAGTGATAAGDPAAAQPPATAPHGSGSASHTIPECKAPNLKLSLGAGQQAGAGSDYPALQFTNVSGHTCAIVGFPGVSFVAGDNGQQVGAPAVRVGGIGRQIDLAPGQMASAILQVANTQMFPAQDCRPVSVRGLRVYAPDDTAAMFLANSPAATACSATAMPGGVQLSVRTITAGNGAQ
jgi:hypothetical protein